MKKKNLIVFGIRPETIHLAAYNGFRNAGTDADKMVIDF